MLSLFIVVIGCGVEVNIALHRHIALAVDLDEDGDIFVGVGMRHTGGKAQHSALGLVENKTFENAGAAVVIVEE